MDMQFIRPTGSATTSYDPLPNDLTAVLLKRLVILALCPPALVMLGNLVNLFNSFVIRITPFGYSLLEGAHDAVIIAISLAVAWVVHRRRLSTRKLIRLGLFYCVFASAWFAAVECLVVIQYPSVPIQFGVSYFSFNLVWVVFFPAIVPMRWRTAVATILPAAASPLIIRRLAQYNGWVEFAEGSITFLTIAMIFSVLLGLAVSRVIYQLGRSVSEAREMGSYRLEKNLGSGGMGEVWSASHRMLARPAAVKFVKHDVLAGKEPARIEQLNQRFEHEVQATAALQSPHTVEIYDYGVTPEGTFYYVMELLEGIDMDTLVKRYGPVAPERAVYLLRQVCHSLHEAHRRQLIHRDIKPANLFVCEYGEDRDFVKVLDFGLVKQHRTGGHADPQLTLEGGVPGTPAYLYPEAISGTHPIDHRSDIYSLGCVVYWLLTGRPVFEAGTPMAMMAEQVKSDPVAPSQRSEFAIPEELDDLVLACLAKDPKDRPASAEALAEQLAAVEFERSWDQERARGWWELHLDSRRPSSE